MARLRKKTGVAKALTKRSREAGQESGDVLSSMKENSCSQCQYQHEVPNPSSSTNILSMCWAMDRALSLSLSLRQRSHMHLSQFTK